MNEQYVIECQQNAAYMARASRNALLDLNADSWGDDEQHVTDLQQSAARYYSRARNTLGLHD